MRALISALAVAGLFAVALPGYAADDVKSGGPSAKPGRSIDDSVKSGGATDKPGRSIDDSVKSGGATDKPGRAVDDSTVKSGGASTKPSRAADDGTVKSGGASAPIRCTHNSTGNAMPLRRTAVVSIR